MVYTFTCTVSEKQERVTRISEVSVHQQIAGSAPVCVAQIHDEFWGDGRETSVTFSGGSLSVSRQYDTIKDFENGFEYVVSTDDASNIPLLMAIFTLPFATHNGF